MSELPLVFLAERLELPASSGTDVALAARKLRLLGQLRSGLGPWGAIVSAVAATTIAARAAKAPIATVAIIDSKMLQFPGFTRLRRNLSNEVFAGLVVELLDALAQIGRAALCRADRGRNAVPRACPQGRIGRRVEMAQGSVRNVIAKERTDQDVSLPDRFETVPKAAYVDAVITLSLIVDW